MSVVAILADPPRPGLVLTRVVEETPLSAEEAAELYAAGLQDTIRAAAESGGDPLVNYRADEDIPAEFQGDRGAESELRHVAADVIEDVDALRFEEQVGSTPAARAGNTATHLLREEGEDGVILLDGTAPFVTRVEIDSAAMKLRSSEVVVGPAARGHVALVGLTDLFDFEAAYDPPELESMASAAVDAGLRVDFISPVAALRREADLVSVVATLHARMTADRAVPPYTAAAVEALGLRVRERDGTRRVVRSD